MVERWNYAVHGEMLAHWRAPKPTDFALLPATGFVVNRCVAGFLYLTDSSLAYIDCMVANPEASSMEILASTQLLEEQLAAVALGHGVKVIHGSTNVGALRHIALRLGYRVEDGFTNISRRLDHG